jgi:renalase
MATLAIIGAGLTGLTAAHQLGECAKVTLFDKSRGTSGRMATRRAAPYAFDHGAQFFKIRSDAFGAFVDPMIRDGVVGRWDARFVEVEDTRIVKRRQWGAEFPHYVGMPGMNAMGKYLAQGLDVRLGTRIQSMQQTDNRWALYDEQGALQGLYDWVVSTVPAQQAAELLPASLPFYSTVSAIHLQSCFSLMLGFEHPIDMAFDAALVRERDISWISVNSSKPGRNSAFSLLVHSSNQWADQHLEDNRDDVMEYLCRQTSEVIGCDVRQAGHLALHGWRFANIERQSGPTHFLCAAQRVGVSGDWLIQGRVEAAFKSGSDLAEALKREL